jgi:hypothetical protein
LPIGFLEKVGDLSGHGSSGGMIALRDGVVDLREQAPKLDEHPAPTIAYGKLRQRSSLKVYARESGCRLRLQSGKSNAWRD